MRIKRANDGGREGDGTIKKVSSNSVSVGDRSFTFDSVFDSKADQVQLNYFCNCEFFQLTVD